MCLLLQDILAMESVFLVLYRYILTSYSESYPRQDLSMESSECTDIF